ncbi:stage II sporulation protein D [Dehalobacter sp. DCM]|uniref:stage II sporulation protein D n=1 Tax=Dehalobacter sp. DCM TaxID=2907827 RepID=UPI003081469C|nr:stage II sporulation protein D [Dehalobacter sp. DCM]
MGQSTNKITAVIMAVIFFLGIVPVAVRYFFDPDEIKNGTTVRVKLSDGHVKEMAIESYLVGVVAAEMPASFEREALKAQAVAARTYVVKKMQSTAESSYDVDTTVKTQAWISNEQMIKNWGIINYVYNRNKILKAVKTTQGLVLSYDGEIIDAFFHSSSGRKNTEKSGDVWSSDRDYLRNVSSGEIRPLRFIQHQKFTSSEFYRLLGFSSTTGGISDDDISVLNRTAAGRVKTLVVRNKIFKGTDIRTKLQLTSTDFEWKTNGTQIEFIAYGKGHGIGMSQYGANDLAQNGDTYTEILGHYYVGAKLKKLY